MSSFNLALKPCTLVFLTIYKILEAHLFLIFPASISVHNHYTIPGNTIVIEFHPTILHCSSARFGASHISYHSSGAFIPDCIFFDLRFTNHSPHCRHAPLGRHRRPSSSHAAPAAAVNDERARRAPWTTRRRPPRWSSRRAPRTPARHACEDDERSGSEIPCEYGRGIR